MKNPPPPCGNGSVWGKPAGAVGFLLALWAPLVSWSQGALSAGQWLLPPSSWWQSCSAPSRNSGTRECWRWWGSWQHWQQQHDYFRRESGASSFVFVMVILSGRVLGARLGFVVGELALAVSSLMWAGLGPGVRFQMLAVGWVGAMAGLLPRWKGRAKVELGMLMVYGAAASYAFGLLMNVWFWPVVLGSGTSLSLVEGRVWKNAASFSFTAWQPPR